MKICYIILIYLTYSVNIKILLISSGIMKYFKHITKDHHILRTQIPII